MAALKPPPPPRKPSQPTTANTRRVVDPRVPKFKECNHGGEERHSRVGRAKCTRYANDTKRIAERDGK